MSNKEVAKEVFEAGIANEDTRDMIVVEMVKSGVSLNSAQIWYKDFAKAAGLTTARAGHKAEALELIDGTEVDLTDDEERAAMRDELVKKFGVATSTANDYIKAYATANDIELPKSNFGGDPESKAKIYEWITANMNCDKAEFKEFMERDMGRSTGSIDETWRGIELARKLQSEGHTFA